jgi:hypothetical protein
MPSLARADLRATRVPESGCMAQSGRRQGSGLATIRHPVRTIPLMGCPKLRQALHTTARSAQVPAMAPFLP